MDRRDRLKQAVEEAERELDAARGCTAIKAASKKLQDARRELKRIDVEKPKRPTSRARGPASA